MELQKERFEKKLLGADCWIDLIEDVKVKVDYPTAGQMTEVRRLRNIWDLQQSNPDIPHFYEAYINYTVRDVTGYTIGSKPSKYRDSELVSGDTRLNFFAVLVELGLVEVLVAKIMKHLDFDKVEKKSSKSQQGSSKTESSSDRKPLSPETSSMRGQESTPLQAENVRSE